MLALLNKDFPEYYNLNRKVVVEYQSYDSSFPLTDSKSCIDCQANSHYFYRQCYEKVVLNVAVSQRVDVISIENYFQQYNDKVEIASGGRCDFLLYSTDKVAFIDLTCSRPAFVEDHLVANRPKPGKRSIAFKQLKDSITKLSVCPAIDSFFQNCVEKVAILALRKKEFVFEVDSSPELHMQTFMKMSNEHARSGVIQDMGNGFSFIVYEYPNVYVW